MKLASFTALVGAGLGAGVAVALRAHRAPVSPWWDQRVGCSRLRRSDLPVGGTAALLAAVAMHRAGRGPAALAATAVGIGAAAGALGTGLAEPLAPAPS
jgi:hypothetical protein